MDDAHDRWDWSNHDVVIEMDGGLMTIGMMIASNPQSMATTTMISMDIGNVIPNPI